MDVKDSSHIDSDSVVLSMSGDNGEILNTGLQNKAYVTDELITPVISDKTIRDDSTADTTTAQFVTTDGTNSNVPDSTHERTIQKEIGKNEKITSGDIKVENGQNASNHVKEKVNFEEQSQIECNSLDATKNIHTSGNSSDLKCNNNFSNKDNQGKNVFYNYIAADKVDNDVTLSGNNSSNDTSIPEKYTKTDPAYNQSSDKQANKDKNEEKGRGVCILCI